MVMNVRLIYVIFRVKGVPVTTAWRVFSLPIKERPPPHPPIWMVAANLLNKILGTADKEWSSSLRVRRGVNNTSASRRGMLRNISQGLGLILWYDAPVVKGHEVHTGF